MYLRLIVDGSVGARRICACEMSKFVRFWDGDKRFVLKLYCLGACRGMVVMSEFYIPQNLVWKGRTRPLGVFQNISFRHVCSISLHFPEPHAPPNTAHSMVSETCAPIMMENITYFHQFAKSGFFSLSHWSGNITETVISRATADLWKSSCRPPDTKCKKM